MSMSARYHAREWAKGKSATEIADRIAALRAAPEWQGAEFDDARVRHMRQTEINTLSDLLNGMLASEQNAAAEDAQGGR